jgi:hypothetical protein
MIKFKQYPNSNSSQNQESFVLNVTQEKRQGYYVEIGAGPYQEHNNTWLLETEYNWTGISLDTDSLLVDSYNSNRKNPCVLQDGSVFNFDEYFVQHNFPKQIDFLQIDVDHVPENIALLTLLNMPLSRYRFSVICFEHDNLQSWKFERIKDLSREILTMYGYQLVVREAGEDFWVDPLYISHEIWQPLLGQHYRSSSYHKI